MHDVRPSSPDQIARCGVCLAIPERRPGGLPLAHRLDVVIVASEANHLVALRFQQIAFVGKDLVFAARLPVKVVAQKDSHGRHAPRLSYFCFLVTVRPMASTSWSATNPRSGAPDLLPRGDAHDIKRLRGCVQRRIDRAGHFLRAGRGGVQPVMPFSQSCSTAWL